MKTKNLKIKKSKKKIIIEKSNQIKSNQKN